MIKFLLLGLYLPLFWFMSTLNHKLKLKKEQPTSSINFPVREVDSLEYSLHIVEMQDSFGNNKFIIPKYKLQCLIALSFFPEFKNIHIDFIYSSISTTMQCKPTINSIRRDPDAKEYIIAINNNELFEGVLLNNVPFNAQIGVISHELCHILDYERQSTLGILHRGLEYFNDVNKKEYEQYIDSLTISRGLGWQLYDWSDYVLNKSNATMDYKNFKRKIYLTPQKILNLIGYDHNYKNALPHGQIIYEK